MTDWAAIASSVATISANLLASLSGNSSGSAPQSPPYILGDIVWSLDSHGAVYAYNTGVSEESLFFVTIQTASNGVFSATTLYQPLPQGQSAIVPLASFTSGSVCLGRPVDTADATKASPNLPATTTILIPFPAIPGLSMKIIDGLSLSLGMDSKTRCYQLSLASTGPVLQSVAVTVTDITGDGVIASAAFQNPPANNIYAFEFPAGVGFNPVGTSLNLGLTVTMDNASYVRATEDSRRNLMQGPPKRRPIAGARP